MTERHGPSEPLGSQRGELSSAMPGLRAAKGEVAVVSALTWQGARFKAAEHASDSISLGLI